MADIFDLIFQIKLWLWDFNHFKTEKGGRIHNLQIAPYHSTCTFLGVVGGASG